MRDAPPGAEGLDGTRAVALAAAVGLSAWFAHSPWLYPLKLLGIMMHESGHALAALLVGGSVEAVVLEGVHAGHCLSRIPDGFLPRLVVFSAGYLGNAVAAAALVALTFRHRAHRFVQWAMVAWLLVMGVLYAGTWFTRGFCVGTALLLAAAARWLPPAAGAWLNLFIAGYAVVDVGVSLVHGLWVRSLVTDADLLWERSFVPPWMSILAWTALTVAILGWAGWYTVRGRKA